MILGIVGGGSGRPRTFRFVPAGVQRPASWSTVLRTTALVFRV